MSYQVLARKWRPRGFAEMVGQEHVLRALSNALDSGRLHHAFLFTGTRGVGKTTLARILAKSLNCETGISSTPCGVCNTCREIDDGRFVDLIEVDAASRTKVEDTRDLLDNVQYAPTRGRYKVYLIDEVHMLSGHSFNALLKTLEEPPPHVKFLLATTDPQKLPVTILSRCLQFNLRRLSIEKIQEHLKFILEQEAVNFEMPALLQLARAADGSMRDALSLLDQSIAFGNGEVNDADVRAMLGTIEQTYVYDLLDALAAEDGNRMIQRIHEMAQHSPDFSGVLAEIMTCLHYLALLKLLPDSWDQNMGDRERIFKLVEALSAEDIQLYYQIALQGRKDLPLVPDQRNGLEMIMLRMLAFRPVTAQPVSSTQPSDQAVKKNPVRNENAAVEVTAVSDANPGIESGPGKSGGVAESNPTIQATDEKNQAKDYTNDIPQTKIAIDNVSEDNWHDIASGLQATGLLNQLIEHCAFIVCTDKTLSLALAPSHTAMLTAEREKQFQQKLAEYFSTDIRLQIETQDINSETPAARTERKQQEKQAQAEQSILNDNNVKNIMDAFNAEVDIKSVKPVESATDTINE